MYSTIIKEDNNEENYYKFMIKMRDKIEKKYPDKDKGFISYELNITAI